MAPAVANFPRIDGRRTGLRHHAVFALTDPQDGGWPLSRFDRINPDEGPVDGWSYPRHLIPEEHVFVPRGDAEGDGWLLSPFLDLERRVAGLSVFDARHLADGPLWQGILPYPLPLGLHGTFVPAGGGTRLTTRRLRQESPQDAGSAEGRRSTIQLWLEAFMSPFQVVWPRMHFMARMARENGFGRRPRRRPCRVALLKCHSLHRWSPMAEAPPTATLDGAVPGSTGALCLT